MVEALGVISLQTFGGGIVTSGSAVGSTMPVLGSLTSKCQRASLPMVSNASPSLSYSLRGMFCARVDPPDVQRPVPARWI